MHDAVANAPKANSRDMNTRLQAIEELGKSRKERHG